MSSIKVLIEIFRFNFLLRSETPVYIINESIEQIFYNYLPCLLKKRDSSFYLYSILTYKIVLSALDLYLNYTGK